MLCWPSLSIQPFIRSSLLDDERTYGEDDLHCGGDQHHQAQLEYGDPKALHKCKVNEGAVSVLADADPLIVDILLVQNFWSGMYVNACQLPVSPKDLYPYAIQTPPHIAKHRWRAWDTDAMLTDVDSLSRKSWACPLAETPV